MNSRSVLLSFFIFSQAAPVDNKVQIPPLSNPQSHEQLGFLEPDLLAATKALKSSRRRERIVRNVQKATERWQHRMEKQFKKIQDADLSQIKNKTDEIQEATIKTMDNVHNLGERLVRHENAVRADVDHLSQKSNSMESRLEKLEKLLAQREEEDYYISGIENDYPNDEVENSDVVEALEKKLANLESYVREVWNVINVNYKQANMNKQTFASMKNEISRLDSVIDELRRSNEQQRSENLAWKFQKEKMNIHRLRSSGRLRTSVNTDSIETLPTKNFSMNLFCLFELINT